ncbi:MAG: tRNA (adenosine(37)-N6)-threonylcarbamoyltransferase complex ATPase subunit type 1 TsaE [Bacteroidetes bacterium]|nr:tRNA (adenosine(37)-N6)-threonylcarbamoyltransferase complex ATPase subunit type 1 TsaE [Bacteroidota bacterium]
MKFVVNSEAELLPVARQIIAACPSGRVFALYGTMGAGKTTFVKAMCQALGVADIVQSPTFSIVNEYKTTTGESIFHFDFYRIRNIAEVFDIGYEDYLYSGNYCFMEWPELIETLMPDNVIRLRISGESQRIIEVTDTPV